MIYFSSGVSKQFLVAKLCCIIGHKVFVICLLTCLLTYNITTLFLPSGTLDDSWSLPEVSGDIMSPTRYILSIILSISVMITILILVILILVRRRHSANWGHSSIRQVHHAEYQSQAVLTHWSLFYAKVLVLVLLKT